MNIDYSKAKKNFTLNRAGASVFQGEQAKEKSSYGFVNGGKQQKKRRILAN